MTGDEKGYNGWRNYETWCYALWMDNEEGSQAHYAELAREIYRDAEASRTFTRREQARLSLMDALKDECEENRPDLGCTVWSDMLGAAISEIDWREIADNLLSEVTDEIDAEDEDEDEGEDEQ